MKASEMMELKNWVVAGDVLNNEKYAYKIKNSLEKEGYTVDGVNPKETDESVFNSLKEVKRKIDVVDLCINPKRGLDIVKEAKEIGAMNVLIQPGAASEEIIDFCKDNGMNVVEGCALVELKKRK